MIAYDGKSAVDVARLFNEHKVGGKQTWSDSRVRQHYGREKLIGKDVFRKTKQVTDRQTGKKKVIHLPASEWIWRDVPHQRILSDELAEAVKRKLGLGAESFGRKVAAQVLKALVGDVILETRQVEGQPKPQMVARFTINAVPALAVLERNRPKDQDEAPVSVWDSIHASPGGKPATTAGPAEVIVPLIYDRRAAARKEAKKRDGAA